MEDGVQTLLYDDKCCHIQGVCEWVACKDVVVSKLADGAIAAVRMPSSTVHLVAFGDKNEDSD